MDLRSGTTIAGQLIWHAGNMGSGSGLSSDTVRGYAPDTSATANTLILRDSSGNATANIFTTTTVRGVNVGVLDAGTAYYTTFVSNSSTDLTADRTITLDINNASRVLYLYTNFQAGHATNTGTVTIYSSGTGATTIIGPSGGTATLQSGTAALNNQTMYVGTTAIAINRASAAQSLTGTSIDGSAGSVALHSANEINIGGSYAGGARLYVNYNDGGSITEYGMYNGGTAYAGMAAAYYSGGSGTTDALKLRSTTGVGTTGADIIFQVGNNGATEAMRILNSGYVGIGTTSPSTLLEIQTSVASATPIFRIHNEQTGQNLVQRLRAKTSGGAMVHGDIVLTPGANADQGIIGFRMPYNASIPGLVVEHTGNVGIGTTTPGTKLQVYQAEVSAGFFSFDSAQAGNPINSVYIKAPASDTLSFYTGSSERVRINSSGYVGIGEAAPGTSLVVKSTNPNVVQLYRTTANNCHIQYQNPSYTTFAGISGSGGFGIGPNIDLANAATWLTITPAAGNVGLGESAPAEKLHINGNIRVDDASGNDGFKIAFDNSSKTLNFMYVGA